MILEILLLSASVGLPQRQPPPLFTVELVRNHVTGFGKHKPKFLGIAHGSATFTLTMQDGDSIGTFIKCEDMVHQRGGGVCRVDAHSIRPGKHNQIVRKYADVGMTVAPEENQ
jgi:hypothetical protein